jgi:hypothetical protein
MSTIECEALRFLREVNDAGKKGFNAWGRDLQLEFMQKLMARYHAQAQPVESTHGKSGERILFVDGSSLLQRYDRMGTFHVSTPDQGLWDQWKEYFA